MLPTPAGTGRAERLSLLLLLVFEISHHHRAVSRGKPHPEIKPIGAVSASLSALPPPLQPKGEWLLREGAFGAD